MQYFFITGSAGFIGSSLCEELLKDQNNLVIGIDNFDDFYPRQTKEVNLAKLKESKNFLFYEADIKSSESLKKIASDHKIDQIVHLAANAGVRPSLLDPRKYYDNNVLGTLNALELCREFKIPKLIFASSSSVYGQMQEFPLRENMNLGQPISPYASTKLACEHLCYTYSHLYNIKIAALRFFTVYGPKQRPDLAIHKFSNLIFNDKEIEVYGDGKTKRDYTFISDIIGGIIGAINYDKTPFEIFNLGESRSIELSYLINLLEINLGKKAKIKYCPKQPGDVDATYADISKALELLNYKPQTAIEDGIKIFAQWFLSNQKNRR